MQSGLARRSIWSIPYGAYGLITGAWPPVATVDRSSFEFIPTGVVWPTGGLLAVGLVPLLRPRWSTGLLALVGAFAALSILATEGMLLVISVLVVGAASQSLFSLGRNNVPTTELVLLGTVVMLSGLVGVGIYALFGFWSLVVVAAGFMILGWQVSAEVRSVPFDRWPLDKTTTVLAFAVGVAAYGTIPLAVAITVDTVGEAWVTPQMAAYAIGGILAGKANKVIPNHRLAIGVLVAMAGASWLVPLVGGPGIVVARFVSGISLFVVQGRLEVAASRSGNSTQATNLAAVKASIGLGAVLSGLWVGLAVKQGLLELGTLGFFAGLIVALLTVPNALTRSKS